ncbi:hypothetical protein PC129_g10463 [Phytophthora cactorum]|uniref:Uncharacterized protein n=1 Tax=Phytophthora cactorum TaxID=29920 RepID=A0A329SML0_9STRA|nr:hypothetical protein Pcac1_g6248 [Phytophthora cactorum]KAG2818206.1 hypothetical protein PC111_g12397 [Phytophthora cactorum]KAG2819920.1 hypothetical protein PC112_g11983 [Phytophthora cactorum]KAG2854334.1 hypothetical protein PC113_g13400 [Phytophthora cactorum]KAG2899227.1 hypothetical protein PC114_g13993 [Phytophthora cactorum]
MHEAYAFLEPWCAVLRGRLAMENRFSDNLWLSVRPPLSLLAILNREAAEIRLLREALELLSLVAIVDNEACKFLLLERCDLKLDDQFDEEIIPRFIFRSDAEHLRYSALLPSATIRQFFLGHRTSAAFQAARSTILKLHRGRQKVKKWSKIPYTLQFTDLWNVGQSVLSAHWSTLLVTLDEIQKRNEGHKAVVDDGDYFVYELESVQICFGTIPVSRDLPNVVLTMLEMPDLTISELQVSLEQELQIGFFRPGEIHPQDLAAQCRCGMLFNTIFCGRSITKQQVQTVRRSRIESVVIPMFAVDDQTFSGLCTSLAEASEVRKLTINGAFRPLTPTQRTWRWQWLTYALFSDASRSSIEEINVVGVQLSHSDVDAIAHVLETNLPEPNQASDGNLVEYIYAPKGTSVSIKQSITSPNITTTLETIDDFTFRLLQNDEESGRFNVLVPGRGNGVISSHQAYKVLKVAPSSAGITSLSLSIDSNAEQEMAVVLRFLQLVGMSLLKLSIQTGVSAAIDVQAILNACPRLDQLYLDSVQIDLDVLMLEVEKGTANIHSFGLTYYNAPVDVITRFAKKLGDPSSALTNGMRELCLSADNDESPMSEESVQAFLDVLKTNGKLVYLELLVLPELFDRYAAAFGQHHRETLSIEKEKLPLRCRLAFLSVDRVNDIFFHLDSHVIQQIFDFAAINAKRTVRLR